MLPARPLLLLWVFLGISLGPFSLDADTRNVLVLSPFEPQWFNASGLDLGLRSGLQANSSSPVRIFNEYLDLLRFPEVEQQRKLAEYLHLKYADRKLDLIVCVASPSLAFLKQFDSPTFRNIPRVAVLSETEYNTLKQAGSIPVLTTVVFKLQFLQTLNLARALQPELRRVVLLSGASSFDRFWTEQFRQEVSGFPQSVSFEFWSSLSMPDLLNRLKHLPSNTVVLYLTMISDGAGQSLLENEAVELICRSSKVPVYGVRRSYLGLGIVGGHLADLTVTGQAAGEAGAKILRGLQTDALVQRPNTNRLEVDWRQMQRWHLPLKALPAYTSLQFRSPSTWDLYGWKIVAIALVCGAQALLILGLLVHRSRHKTSEVTLRQKSLELRTLAGQLITVQEEERQRIARELHDAFCQQIAVLALHVNKIERSLPDKPPSVRMQFAELETRLTTLASELRQLSHELYPALLKHAGLKAALNRYCREFTALTGIRVDLDINLEQRTVPLPPALCLYRVAQESLNNIAKYAGTNQARISLKERETEYQLIVEDEGIGFDPDKARQKHGIGLSSMEERVHMLNGSMTIRSQPHIGTKVQVTLPIRERENDLAHDSPLSEGALRKYLTQH